MSSLWCAFRVNDFVVLHLGLALTLVIFIAAWNSMSHQGTALLSCRDQPLLGPSGTQAMGTLRPG
jgi:hypothetical protein